jgi:hypothetical protein
MREGAEEEIGDDEEKQFAAPALPATEGKRGDAKAQRRLSRSGGSVHVCVTGRCIAPLRDFASKRLRSAAAWWPPD